MSWRNPNPATVRKIANTVIFLIVLLLFLLALYPLAEKTAIEFVSSKNQLQYLSEKIEEMNAGIGYSEKRKKTVLAIYNRIISENPKLPKNLAYKIADYDYYVGAEVYKSFDPFLLVAIQWKETGGQFDPSMVNANSGATGLNQIMPLTGRWLAKGMHWEWNDDILKNPFRSTDLAGAYLEFLFKNLGKPEYVLAYYNGGERQYQLMKRYGLDSLCYETRHYVKDVLAYRDKIKTLEDVKEFGFPSITDSVLNDSKPKLKKIKKVEVPVVSTVTTDSVSN